MGLFFPLRYTNIVAYFTTEQDKLESTAKDLLGFFYMLQTDEWRLISSHGDTWPNAVREAASAAADVVRKYTAVSDEGIFTPTIRQAREQASARHEPVRVDEAIVSVLDVFADHPELLGRLRFLFHDSHDLFVLGVAEGYNQVENVAGFLRYSLAKTVALNTLFLIPDPGDDSPLDFIDPFPGASLICQYPERWPGVLLWNKHGNSLFLPLANTEAFLFNAELVKQLRTPMEREKIAKIDKGFAPSQASGQQVRFLHLSDLHFGTKHAANKQSFLLAVIKDEFEGQYDRIIITGDLFDSPWKLKWKAWDNFLQSLRLLTKQDPIVIPGNHDSRILGNAFFRFGQSYRYLAQLGIRPIEPDAKLKCIFFCFDSCKKGNFARGEVAEEDLIQLATEYHVLAAQTPDIKDWLRVALVHHHPFKFDSAAEGMTAKLLKAAHIPQNSLLDMNRSDRFIRWCADRGIQLILHGHRHVQRKITQVLPPQNGSTTAQVTAIGCGTSLGAEGIDASFNLVTWHPNTRRWAATFYLDRNAGGFKKIRTGSTIIDS